MREILDEAFPPHAGPNYVMRCMSYKTTKARLLRFAVATVARRWESD